MHTIFKKRDSNEMKIDHITYEESRRGRTNVARTSASEKVKGFLSSHTPGNSIDNIEKRITAWPQPEKLTPAPVKNFDMTAFLTRERRKEKAVQNQEKVISSANSSGSYLPLKDVKDSTPEPRVSVPQLHQKGSLADLKTFQAAMKSGKLERALPRPVKRGEEGRLAPPRGPLFIPTPSRKSKPSSKKK